MEDKLRRYVDGLFSETVPTKKSVELKEEMIQNLQDKYSDLIGEGKTQEAAYNIVIAGIGDVSGLLQELADEVSIPPDPAAFENARRRSAMLTSIAVMMYILSIMPILILSMMGSGLDAQIGIPCMFIIIAAATGMLVYNNMTKPRGRTGAGTVVEEFRQWQDDNYSRKSLRRAVSSALWSVITVIYLIISFWTGAWHISWIIFIMGAAVEAFINLFFALKK